MTTKGKTEVKARARRDGRWWYIEFPELGTSGQARTIKEIDEIALEVAALWLDVDESTLNVTVALDLPERAAQLWNQANEADARAREDAKAAAALRRSAVAALQEEHISKADAARLLGLSPQRISQLARAS
jgi:transcriptional regulator with GAF, ATPase, and Fis domain